MRPTPPTLHLLPRQSRPPPERGFTLVELLLALAVLAMMALLSWRGIDAMLRVQSATQARADALLTVQAGLGQWQADLDAMLTLERTQALEWDGRVLRITRRSSLPDAAGPVVVAWTRRADGPGLWLRWQSPPLPDQRAWQDAWARAALWAHNPGESERRSEVTLFELQGWQLFYFRGNAWSNPLSAAGAPHPGLGTRIPDGVRLVLDLPSGAPLAGRITSDWARPTLSPAEPAT